MKKYEISFIVAPTVEKDGLESIVEELKGIITTNGGEILEVEDLGSRELAYEIEDFKKGHYYLFNVNSTHEINLEFDRLVKINENVIRHIIIAL